MPMTLTQAAADLAAGRITSRALVEQALARIAEPGGEGARAFVEVQAEAARAAAEAIDALRRVNRAPSPWAGVPISVKDLYDQAGSVTRAGSLVHEGDAPAARTALCVERLERAGFVVLGRTNMVEFAFSGLGVNPYHGTPASPWDRANHRLPGGSSSGAAVAVADGMGLVGLGSDTGGSCRVPAALCGLVGCKPTALRVPLDGTYPLSHSLDSLGPIASSVACCAITDAIMAGEERPEAPVAPPLAGLRFGVPRGTYLTDGLDATVASRFAATLDALSRAGARITEFDLPELADIPRANAAGGFVAAEAWAHHRELITAHRAKYDPRILARILRGEAMGAADYVTLQRERARLIAVIAPRTAPFDAVLAPTCALIPPRLAEVEQEAEYNRINLLLLRNTSVANFLDRCSISIPCHAPGGAPVGLMLVGEHMGDARLFAVASAVEALLTRGEAR
jgi:aspartyl-tRNA(Asn)/glutamyl-tRNA(Gln) amidotransferase subunit A